MTSLTNLRPAARRVAAVALSSVLLYGAAAAAGVSPVADSGDPAAPQTTAKTDKVTKSKATGRKIT